MTRSAERGGSGVRLTRPAPGGIVAEAVRHARLPCVARSGVLRKALRIELGAIARGSLDVRGTGARPRLNRRMAKKCETRRDARVLTLTGSQKAPEEATSPAVL